MPEKYHIETRPVPPRLARIGKYGVVDWREDCARCHNCVKKACVYDRHRQEAEYIRNLSDVDSLFFECMGCFSCVQNCTKGLLGLVVNPVYENLGNAYWTPDIIQTTWTQAETAKIPVSGAGYKGPFSGHGFDSMWTDMSEIVRPTRDGIHGREYISTAVDIGRKPPYLAFEGKNPAGTHPPLVSIPMPLLIDMAPPQYTLPSLGPILRETAVRTGLIAIVHPSEWPFNKDEQQRHLSHTAFCLDPETQPVPKDVLDQTKLLEIPDSPDVLERIREVKESSGDIVISVRISLDSNGSKRAVELAGSDEIEVIHVAADLNGNEARPELAERVGTQNPRFLKDAIREIHASLVESGIRDEITLIASGGIALAEHMAKAIICGADLVTVDLPLLIALECQLCNQCKPGMSCPAKLEKIDFDYAVGRMTNLIAAWHDQLIEVMGAMGMREVRRLRGDVGRAMFFEQLEEETFGKLRGEGVPPLRREAVSASLYWEQEQACPEHSRRNALATEQGQDALATNEGEAPALRNLKEILPEKTFQTRVPQAPVARVVKAAPSRYRNNIAKYIIRRSSECIRCGKCVELCPYGVHVDKPGYKYFAEPRLDLCIGPACEKTDHYCVAQCPQKALRMVENPMMKGLGDYRWTADMILATWKMAETGDIPAPEYGYEYHCGNSGGGFDRLRFKFPDKPPVEIDENDIDTSIELNRRNDGRPRIKIDVPWYGGGMSFGSVSNVTQLSKARGAVAWNTFTCTGEGGYMERLRPYDDHVITQVATGLFGVREETIQRVPIVEFKYAQGAKPGLGGHLLGDKNTVSVSKMREAVLGISLFSPFPFHSVYSIEDHAKHLDWIKHVNRRALVSTKVSTPTDVDMVAVGSCAAGTHIVHLDGGYGGTGAAPDIAKKNIAMPIEYAIGKVHAFLEAEGVRDTVTLIASGGIRTAHDIAKAIALGADGVVVGTSELIALGCVRCTRCESGRGCPRGIATTDTELAAQMDINWGTQRIINLYNAWRKALVQILRRFGMRSVSELRGRTDLLMHLDYTNDVEPKT